MHIFTYQRFIIYTFLDFQISSVHIDSVVHHTFVQAAYRNDFSFTTGEMSGICLRREVTGIVITTKTYGEFIQCDILTHLRQ